MTNQRLEKDFTKLLKEKKDIYWYRFYHVAGMYSDVPGDFFVQTQRYNYIIECKECKGDRFVFDRLTQYNKLKEFQGFKEENMSYIIICFWKRTVKKSLYFILSPFSFDYLMDRIKKKSANIDDFKKWFNPVEYKYILKYIFQ